MVLGNHEINLMRRAKKHGNHWFWGETEQLCNASPDATKPVLDPDVPSEAVLADPSHQDDYIAFLNTIPVALERPGLIVVHAMYHKASLNALRDFEGNAAEARVEFDRRIQAKLEKLKTEGQPPTGDKLDMMLQNDNPVNVLTTGMEVPAPEPFFAGGKMRTLQRYRWWEDYSGGNGLVVIGHYWRRRPASVDLGVELTGTSLFPGEGARPKAELTSLGCALCPDGSVDGSVVCVDYSVGLRYEERGRGLPLGSLGTALAALRLPERSLHFADGEVAPLAAPTSSIPQ